MNSLEMESEIRALLESADIGALEGLLVDAADWGVNVRMTLNGQFVEVDLIKNWDGFEMILLDDQKRDSIQIDELRDMVQILRGYCWSCLDAGFKLFSKVIFIAKMIRFKANVNAFAIITGLAATWYP